MRVLFWGTPAFAVPSLDALATAGHELVGVVSQPDRRRGRGGRLQPSAVKARAAELGIPVWTPAHVRSEPLLQQQLAHLGAEVYVIVAFGQILPAEVLAQPPLGCWNGHASLLPRWRGAAPIQWTLLEGDGVTGVGIMAMEATLDTGPVLLQRTLTIGACENATSLSARLSHLTATLLLEALPVIASGRAGPEPQASHGVSYARMLGKEDFRLHWDQTALAVHRRVMGVHPHAATWWCGQRIKILATVPLLPALAGTLAAACGEGVAALARQSWPAAPPGTVLNVRRNQGLVVATTDAPVLVQEAQLAGRRPCRGTPLLQVLEAKEGMGFDLTEAPVRARS